MRRTLSRIVLALMVVPGLASCSDSPDTAAKDELPSVTSVRESTDQASIAGAIRGTTLIEANSIEILRDYTSESSYKNALLELRDPTTLFTDRSARTVEANPAVLFARYPDQSIDDVLGPDDSRQMFLVTAKDGEDPAAPETEWITTLVLNADSEGAVTVPSSPRLTKELASFTSYVREATDSSYTDLDVLIAWLADREPLADGVERQPFEPVGVDAMWSEHLEAQQPVDPSRNTDRSTADPEIVDQLVDRVVALEIDAVSTEDLALAVRTPRGDIASILLSAGSARKTVAALPGEEPWEILVVRLSDGETVGTLGTIDEATWSKSEAVLIYLTEQSDGGWAIATENSTVAELPVDEPPDSIVIAPPEANGD